MVELEAVVAPNVKSSFTATVGGRFRQGREAAGVNASQLGRAIGKTPQAISQFELGKQQLDLDVFALACEALRLNVRWVLHGRGAMTDTQAPAGIAATRPARKA